MEARTPPHPPEDIVVYPEYTKYATPGNSQLHRNTSLAYKGGEGLQSQRSTEIFLYMLQSKIQEKM